METVGKERKRRRLKNEMSKGKMRGRERKTRSERKIKRFF